jgi:type I restriction enzyme S subunit
LTPIAREIENLFMKNSVLRSCRDLLLPRLVSGEVDVSELAIDPGTPDGSMRGAA